LPECALKKLGKYEVLGELGHGAMGVVYRARDPIINRLVALKTITTGLASDPALLERFYREAQSAGGLQHPNIVTIYDMGEAASLPYIAMELVEGENLEQLIARRVPLPITLKLAYAMQACRAFDYAHKRGIVHRDIKPGNVMLGKDGTVKVVDFGIARVLENSKTQTGMLIGTFAYMSPEQYHGEHADERSDIWSFGVLLYELLAYQRPFVRPTPAGLMNAICNEEPPPLSTHIGDIPNELQIVVTKILQKSPTERYQSMEDVLLELDPVLKTLQVQFVVDLVTQSRLLIEQNEYTQARDLLRQALQVESSNAQARSLLEKANAGVRKLLNRPKAQQCVERGQALLDEGKLQQARIEMEHSLEFDSTFAPGLELQKAVLEKLARAKQISEWLEAAKQRLAEGMPEEAEVQLAKILEAEPSNAQAAALQQQAQKERVEREKRQRLSEGMRRARELWTQQNFVECVNVLSGLEKEFPEEDEVHRLLETVREDQAEQQKQRGLVESRNLLAAGRHEDSRARLTELQKQFPQDGEIPRLLEEVRRDQAQQHRSKGLTLARNLLGGGQFDKCVRMLDSLLQEFPDDPEISRLLESVHQNLAEQRRQAAYAQARNLLSARRYDECSAFLKSQEKDFPGDEEILHLQRVVQDEQAQQRKRTSLEQARNLLTARRYDESAALLSEMEKEFPHDGEIEKLQATVREDQAKQRKLQKIDEARTVLASKDYEKASRLLTALQKEFPQESDIRNLLEKARNEQAEQRKRDGMAQGRNLLTARRYDEATELLSKLQGEFSDDKSIAKLLESVKKEQADQRKRDGLAESRKLLAARRYEECIALLSKLQTDFPSDAEISKALSSAREDFAENNKQQKLAEARSLLAAQSFTEALKILDALAAAHPNDSAVVKFRALVQREQENTARAKKIQKELDGLKTLMAEKRYPEVAARADALLAEFPTDQNVVRLAEFAKSQQAAIEKENLLRKTAQDAKVAFDAGNFEEAIRITQGGLKTFPANQELLSLYQQSEVQVRKQEVRQQIERRIKEIKVKINREKFSEAIDLAEETLVTLGPDTDLNQLLSSARVEIEAREKKRMQERTLDTIRTLMDSGDLDAASKKIKEVLDSKVLEPFDPRVQRLSEQIQDAKTTPPVVAEAPARPALSKEYAFLQATPIPEAPPTSENKPPAEAPAQSPQMSATQSISWTPAAQPPPAVQPPEIHVAPAERVSPAESAPPSPVVPAAEASVVAEPPVAKPPVAKPPIPEPTVAKPAVSIPRSEPTPAAAPAPPAEIKRAPEAKPAPETKPAPEPKPAHESRRAKRRRHQLEAIQPPEPAPKTDDVEPPKPFFKRTPVLAAAAVGLAIAGWATVHFIGSSESDSAVTRVRDSDSKVATSSPAPSGTTTPNGKSSPNPAEQQQRDAIALSDKLIASGDVTGALDTLKGAEKAGGPLTAEIRGREDTIAKLERNDAVAQLWVQATRELDQAQFTAAKRDLQKLSAIDDGPRHAEAHKDLDEVLPRRQKEEALFSQAERIARATDQKSQQRASNLLDQVIALDGPRKADAANLQRQLSAKTASAKQDAGKLQNQNPPVTTPAAPPQTQQQPLIPQETKDWYQARDSNDASQLEQYLATYPNGSHTPDAQSKLQDLVWNRTRTDDISGLDAYVKRFPGSPHAQEATRRLDDLHWNKTNKNDSVALSDFLSRYPGSAHRSDAQAQLNQLTAAANAKPAAANPPPAPAPVAPATAPASQASAEPDIRAAIQRYINAFNNRDADALRAVWPTLGSRYGKYKDSFRMASSIQEQVNIDSVEISSDGTKATVRGQSSLAYTGKSDKSPHTVTGKALFQLTKSGGGWTITDVQ
jgi:serine/threonine protein kinase